jgi:processive 1,2-diacylglycerol beta-glucosyltransferase
MDWGITHYIDEKGEIFLQLRPFLLCNKYQSFLEIEMLGGLSSTEAAIKNIPIIHTAPIPGCESKNAEFFKSRFMSYSSKYIIRQLKAAAKICSDDFYRCKIIQAQKENIVRDSCDKIYRLLTELNGR